ncbi:MAG TPA: hypothetical protein VKH81_08000 [Candidatus Angelobacter sp.]|nr:hypothetical protein [Candidatus Angelobacter sp.]
MRDILVVLQLFAAIFLAIVGLALAFSSPGPGTLMFGALLGGIGLTFLVLLFVNLRRPE